MPVPPVDPNAPKGPVKRAMTRLTATSAGRWFGMNVAEKVDAKLLARTNGRVALPGAVMPIASMTTTGAKSGRPRTTPILYFTQGDDVILIASNFGRQKHPAWLHNLRRNPEFTMFSKGQGGRYVAKEVEDRAERDRLYALAVQVFSGYAGYEDRASNRHIRVMRCSPAP